MTHDKSILLSCAPHWSHPDTNNSLDEISKRNSLHWRDHWMQGIYFLPKQLRADNEYVLTATHDEFSWFFDVKQQRMDEENNDGKNERAICNCIFHMCNSRNRIMQINDDFKRAKFIEMMQRVEPKSVLFLGDHSLLSLIASHTTKAEKIIVLQEDELCLRSVKQFIECNKLEQKICLISDLSEIRDEKLTHVIAEPYFQASVLPIDNITAIWSIVSKMRSLTREPFRVLPQRVKIYAAPVHFLHLHKIRWPLKTSCEGFEHSCFDKVIERASEIADENVESFSLWEYPCFSVATASEIFEVKFNEDQILQRTAKVAIEDYSRSCNGIAFWTDWMLDERQNSVISTGPSKSIKAGELINWKFDRQTVHLIPYKKVEQGILRSVDIKSHFDASEGKILFDFSYNHIE